MAAKFLKIKDSSLQESFETGLLALFDTYYLD